MVNSAYLHIPFCKSKCNYCSFVSYTDCLSKKDSYVDALCRQISDNYNGDEMKTIYFGGGTPSVLGADELNKILSLFKFSDKTEVTVEVNPDDLNYEYLKRLNDFGVNRLSIGCQTFDDDILKLINRRHNSQQVIEGVGDAQKAGFKNISLDFIYGLPQQTDKMFFSDLKKAAKLGIEHISLYGLTIDEGCNFYKTGHSAPDDDLLADMYLGAIDILKGLNFRQYEISNFSKVGFESRHNLNYWNNAQYYGFGAAAHGYQNGVRYSNPTDLDDYLKNPLKRADEKILTAKEILEEEIFLGFRKVSGISVNEINSKFGIDFEKKYSDILKKYLKLKLLRYESGFYGLTSQGFLLSNTILADFME